MFPRAIRRRFQPCPRRSRPMPMLWRDNRVGPARASRRAGLCRNRRSFMPPCPGARVGVRFWYKFETRGRQRRLPYQIVPWSGVRPMAKIIRCPNCGENVEVPPNPTGQIVTCIACGTAMRLKSRKDAGERKPGDSSQGSLSGSLSGSMSATRITSDTVQASSDDPPDLGSTCDVCGRSVDPSELTEDRGKLACRDCIKGARSSRPRALKGASDDELIPFSGAPNFGPRRAGVFTFGMPFFVGVAALAVYIGCSVLLAFNLKPVGTDVAVKDP